MKTTLCAAVLCLLAAAVLVKAEFNKEEALKHFQTTAEECRGEVGAAASDIEDMVKKMPAAGKEGKCLRACVMKNYHLMDSNGKFDKAAALEKVKKWTDGDAEKIKTAGEIMDICGTISVNSDHCEAAEEYGKCFKNEFQTRGIEKDSF